MTTSADVLSLVAKFKMEGSEDLKKFFSQFKSGGDAVSKFHKEGAAGAQKHTFAMQDLKKGVAETSEHIKSILTPAMAGLGLAAISVGGAVAGATAAIKSFGELSLHLTRLREETGMNVTSLLALEQEAVRVGSSAEAMDAGLSKFAENLEQWRAGRGAIVEAMKNQQPEIIKFYKSLQGKDTQTAIPMVIEEMKQLREYADKKMMTDALGLDPAVARMTNEELDELRAKIPKLTDDQIKAGVASPIAWFKIREGMHNVSMEIGGRLAPAMTAIYESVARFIEGPAREWIEWSADYVQKNPEVVKAIGLIGGAFIAAAAGAALFALTLSPISVAIASIAAGAVLINEAFKHWDERKGRHAEDMGLQGPEALPEGKS